MICDHLLWSNGPQAPLMVLIPGGTGSCKTDMPAFPASEGFFWLRGYSCYIAETSGQDGNPGVFSLTRCLDEYHQAKESLRAWLTSPALLRDLLEYVDKQLTNPDVRPLETGK